MADIYAAAAMLALLHNLLRNRGGNVAVTFGICAVAIVVAAGGGIDLTRATSSRAAIQDALDAAVLAGAKSGSDSTATSYFQKNLNAPNVTVGTPAFSHPTGTTYKGTVTAQMPTSFLGLIGLPQVAIAVSATASTNPSSGACILAMDPAASKAITISGSGIVNSPSCDVVANSNNSDAIDMSGSANVTAACMKTVGDVHNGATLTLMKCTSPTVHTTATADPYASIPEPAIPGSCISTPSGSNITLTPGYYCHGISIGGSTSATFQPGLYYVDGGNLAFSGTGVVNGSGVTFFVAAGRSTALSGGSNTHLSAPTTGTYAGMLFFGSRSGNTSTNNNFSGSSSAVITGAVYYPTQQVTYSGSTGQSTNCTQLVGDKITVSGNANFQSNCAAAGLKPIGGSTGIVLLQ